MASTSASMEIDVEQPHEVRRPFHPRNRSRHAGHLPCRAAQDLRPGRRYPRGWTIRDTVSDPFRRQEIYRRHPDLRSLLAPNPVEAVSDLLRQNSALRLVVVTPSRIRNLLSNCFAAACTESFAATSSPNFWSNACAKSPKVIPGWIAAAPNGCSRPFVPRARARVTAPQSAVDSEGIAHRLLRDPGHEEQGNRAARRYHRAGGQELSAQGIRQTGRSRPLGTRALLPSQPHSRQLGKAARHARTCNSRQRDPSFNSRRSRKPLLKNLLYCQIQQLAVSV